MSANSRTVKALLVEHLLAEVHDLRKSSAGAKLFGPSIVSLDEARGRITLTLASGPIVFEITIKEKLL